MFFGVFDFLQKKRTKEFDFTTMIPQVDLFLFVFWRKSKKPKRHFEINWPLVITNNTGSVCCLCNSNLGGGFFQKVECHKVKFWFHWWYCTLIPTIFWQNSSSYYVVVYGDRGHRTHKLVPTIFLTFRCPLNLGT